jgi:hypothetical protein
LPDANTASEYLMAPDTWTSSPIERDFPLAHRSESYDPLHRPVRGDLAHIRCAGRIFVPHYAVPMPHRVTEPATLVRTQRSDAETLAALAAGTLFNVLDIAGGWAWGQVGEDGLVGYVPMTALTAA